MEYIDPVYGTVELNEPVLVDLMKSAALQRLKGILQHGISGLIGLTSPITRYEHSLGVMILVRYLGGSLEEQIAALLHDVSHTAFSHVIDYVFNGHDSQSYHEEKKEEYVASTELPFLLASYDYDWREIIHEEMFPILEQPSPRLCADRLDYFLRDSQPLRLSTKREIQFTMDHLVIADGRIATDDLQAARWLGYTFIAADDASWANFNEVGLYELTAHAIRRGLKIGAIDKSDFWLTDQPFWQKLHVHPDPELQDLLKLIKPSIQFAWDEKEPTFQVSTKIRSIDPDVVVNGQLRPLSTLDPDFAQHRQNYHLRKQGKWPMRLVV